MKKSLLLLLIFLPQISFTQSYLYGWGKNDYGQIGIGHNNEVEEPTLIDDSDDWVEIYAGLNHTLGIKSDGSLWAWGDNQFGQLGDTTLVSKNTPILIDNNSNWQHISVSHNHNLAIKSDGTLWVWGENKNFHTGIDTSETIIVATQIGEDNDWLKAEIGQNHIVALKKDSTLWVWGENNKFQLGDGTRDNKLSPSQIGKDNKWINVEAGEDFTLVLDKDNKYWGCGYNENYQLGFPSSSYFQTTLKKYESLSSFHGIKTSYNFTTVYDENNILFGWGSVNPWRIGNSVRVTEIQNQKKWKDVSVGMNHALAINNEGALWLGGNNDYYQVIKIAIPYRAFKNTYEYYFDNKNWERVFAGANHSFALKSTLLSVNNKKIERKSLDIYPNPATHSFNLTINAEYGDYLKIIDLNGIEVYNLPILKNYLNDGIKIDLNNLTYGVYFVQIHFDGKIITDKLIIK